jgi:hypothetical protein
VLPPRPSHGCTRRRADLLSDNWIGLTEAVRRIANRLEADKVDNLTDRRRGWDVERKRTSLAADELYQALRRGLVKSRAGRVFVKSQGDGDLTQPGSTWALGNWSIPASLWQVTSVYNWDRNSAVTWVWPANEPAPLGWPKNGPVHITDIEVVLDDIQRLWPDSEGASQAGETAVLGGREDAPSAGTQNLQATAQLETSATRVLVIELKVNPQLTRDAAAEFCRKSGYSLGKRAFERVWPRAREEAGLPRLGLGGRKPKLTR